MTHRLPSIASTSDETTSHQPPAPSQTGTRGITCTYPWGITRTSTGPTRRVRNPGPGAGSRTSSMGSISASRSGAGDSFHVLVTGRCRGGQWATYRLAVDPDPAAVNRPQVGGEFADRPAGDVPDRARSGSVGRLDEKSSPSDRAGGDGLRPPRAPAGRGSRCTGGSRPGRCPRRPDPVSRPLTLMEGPTC